MAGSSVDSSMVRNTPYYVKFLEARIDGASRDPRRGRHCGHAAAPDLVGLGGREEPAQALIEHPAPQHVGTHRRRVYSETIR